MEQRLIRLGQVSAWGGRTSSGRGRRPQAARVLEDRADNNSTLPQEIPHGLSDFVLS